MKPILRSLTASTAVAVVLAAGGAAVAQQAGENPFAVPATLTCDGELFDVVIVGIPQAQPGSEAAGRPGVALAVGDSTRFVPKSIHFERYVNDRLVAQGTEEWGFGVPHLTTCSQTLEFIGPTGNRVRIELEFQVILTPPASKLP
jgi:hypothetical protein